MHWAVPFFTSVVLLILALVLFWRTAALARKAQARADILTIAMEQSPTMVGITDLEGNLQYVNSAFKLGSGYTAAELLGQNPRLLKSGVTPVEDYVRMWETITGGGTWVGELCNKKKNGELYWVRASIAGVRDRRGKISHFVKVAEEITNQKKSDAAQAESEKKFRRIFDLAGAGMAILNRQGHWLQVNDKLCRIFGYSPEELVGPSFLEVTGETGDRKSITQENRYLAKDGSEVWAECTSTLVRDSLGAPDYYICLVKDVTRRKYAEQALAEQQSQLAHLARIHTLQQMASELAHEIDQPLCAILSASQAAVRLLGSRQPDAVADAQSALAIVAEQAARAGTVVDGIRQFSRKKNPEKKVLAVGEAISQAMALLGPELRHHNVEISVNPLGRPEALVIGDSVLLTQVLLNLCRNGADAMLEGKVPQKVLTVDWEQVDDEVIIRVHNTGPPIAPDLVKKIFTPFFTTRAEGLGLGLSLSRSIVESYGGRLWVEPGDQEGTTFLVAIAARQGQGLEMPIQEPK